MVVSRDPVKAARWFTLAAEKNDPGAVFALAECFETGNGVSVSLLQTRLHFARAVRLGSDGAIKELDRVMAGVFWSHPLRTVFSPQFNGVSTIAMVAARKMQRRRELPHLPLEMWEAIWGFLPYIYWYVRAGDGDDDVDDEENNDGDN